MLSTTTFSAAGFMAIAFCPSILAAERPDLSGKWQGERSSEIVWSIEQDGDKIHIAQVEPAGASKTEITCNTLGKECQGTADGKRVNVTYYYNGPALVEMRIEGQDRVTKTRRTISEDGNKMTVEIQHITPLSDTEKIVYVRRAEQQNASTLR